jgi:hypothetical protein
MVPGVYRNRHYILLPHVPQDLFPRPHRVIHGCVMPSDATFIYPLAKWTSPRVTLERTHAKASRMASVCADSRPTDNVRHEAATRKAPPLVCARPSKFTHSTSSGARSKRPMPHEMQVLRALFVEHTDDAQLALADAFALESACDLFAQFCPE